MLVVSELLAVKVTIELLVKVTIAGSVDACYNSRICGCS